MTKQCHKHVHTGWVSLYMLPWGLLSSEAATGRWDFVRVFDRVTTGCLGTSLAQARVTGGTWKASKSKMWLFVLAFCQLSTWLRIGAPSTAKEAAPAADLITAWKPPLGAESLKESRELKEHGLGGGSVTLSCKNCRDDMGPHQTGAAYEDDWTIRIKGSQKSKR